MHDSVGFLQIWSHISNHPVERSALRNHPIERSVRNKSSCRDQIELSHPERVQLKTSHPVEKSARNRSRCRGISWKQGTLWRDQLD